MGRFFSVCFRIFNDVGTNTNAVDVNAVNSTDATVKKLLLTVINRYRNSRVLNVVLVCFGV